MALGVEKRKRRSYKVWCEGKGPDFVLEVASPSTEWWDRQAKPRTYLQLGVREYWRFDPQADLMPERLQGMRSAAGRYLPQAWSPGWDGRPVLRSEVLGLEAWVDGLDLQLRDAASGRELLNYLRVVRERNVLEAAKEAAEAARAAAEARARREADARQETEAENRRLKALLASLGHVGRERGKPRRARAASQARVCRTPGTLGNSHSYSVCTGRGLCTAVGSAPLVSGVRCCRTAPSGFGGGLRDRAG